MLKLAADASAIATLRAAIQRFPANRRLPEVFEARIGDWIASDVNPYPSGPNRTEEMDAATADIVVDFLARRRISTLDITGGVFTIR